MTQPQWVLEQRAQWGRAWSVGFPTLMGCLALLICSPPLVLYFYISAFAYDASLLGPLQALYSGEITLAGLWNKVPPLTTNALAIVAVWFALQGVLAVLPDILHRIIPRYRGGFQHGSTTPAGNRLLYLINGLQAWVITHVAFVAGAFWFEWFSPTVIFDHFGGILMIANIIGFSVALFAYVKAYLFPSFPDDRKWSGNSIYDFFMGIELNPRVGPFDLKLFFNGRPGIVAWTLINLSFASTQYVRYGHVTNSMLLVNLFHALYVLYFFWKESWYLKTIDICHDHFGWMLAWGDCVWLPYIYTLQGLFLVFHPVELSAGYAAFVLVLGLVGFGIFLAANNQKDRFRRLQGNALIWGKKPTTIPCSYVTKDGEVRCTQLLTSGWWGVARHMNYTGDLILSLAFSLACGFGYAMPYFYIIYITILLVHRCVRDEHRCHHKYGKAWEEYCRQVPYRLIPGIF